MKLLQVKLAKHAARSPLGADSPTYPGKKSYKSRHPTFMLTTYTQTTKPDDNKTDILYGTLS